MYTLARQLTHYQFCLNTTPDSIYPGISPFQLVFGRKPRLSGAGITFPRRISTRSSTPPERKQLHRQLSTKIKQLHLTTLERQLHRKQLSRDKYDHNRTLTKRIKVKRGDLLRLLLGYLFTHNLNTNKFDHYIYSTYSRTSIGKDSGSGRINRDPKQVLFLRT